MRNLSGLFGLVIGLLLAVGCNQAVRSESVESGVNVGNGGAAAWDGSEEQIDLDQVPANVLAAAKAAVPGIEFSGAEREMEHSVVVYALAGTANAKRYEVEVDANGKVTEIEEGEDDDDGVGGDDDDDDDGDDDGDDDDDDDDDGDDD